MNRICLQKLYYEIQQSKQYSYLTRYYRYAEMLISQSNKEEFIEMCDAINEDDKEVVFKFRDSDQVDLNRMKECATHTLLKIALCKKKELYDQL